MKQRLRTAGIVAISAVALLFVARAMEAQQTVYLTPNGKTYHVKRTCMALSAAKSVYVSTLSEALAHHLKPCGICNRAKSTKAKGGHANDWAKEGQ